MPERRDDRTGFDAVGRTEQQLVVLRQADIRSVRGGLGQEREDAAAVVRDEHDGQVHAGDPGRDQGPKVVQERDVTDDEHDRRPGHGRRAKRGRHDAVDAVGTAIGVNADGAARGRQPAVHVADRHRVAGPQDGPVGQDP